MQKHHIYSEKELTDLSVQILDYFQNLSKLQDY